MSPLKIHNFIFPFFIFLLVGYVEESQGQNIPHTRNTGTDSTIALVFSDDSTFHIVLKSTHSNDKFTNCHIDLTINCDTKYQLSKLNKITSSERFKDSIILDTLIIFGPFCSDETKTKLIELQCTEKEHFTQKKKPDYDSLIIQSDLLSDYINTLNQMNYSLLNIDIYRNRILKKRTEITRGLTSYTFTPPCENVLTSLVIRFIIKTKK